MGKGKQVMKRIDWKSRFKNKTFLVSIISQVAIIIQSILAVLVCVGLIDIDLSSLDTAVTAIVAMLEALLVILSFAGIIIDPLTQGIADEIDSQGEFEHLDEEEKKERRQKKAKKKAKKVAKKKAKKKPIEEEIIEEEIIEDIPIDDTTSDIDIDDFPIKDESENTVDLKMVLTTPEKPQVDDTIEDMKQQLIKNYQVDLKNELMLKALENLSKEE